MTEKMEKLKNRYIEGLSNNNFEIIKSCVESGINPNNFYHLLYFHNINVKVLNFLIENGLEIEKNNLYNFFLSISAFNKNIEIVEYLLNLKKYKHMIYHPNIYDAVKYLFEFGRKDIFYMFGKKGFDPVKYKKKFYIEIDEDDYKMSYSIYKYMESIREGIETIGYKYKDNYLFDKNILKIIYDLII